MIQLIVGHKGSGKTKAIVEMANKAVKESKGYVVVIEKDVRLTYEISSAARLVSSDEYVFTLSCEPEDLPYHLRDMMIENW